MKAILAVLFLVPALALATEHDIVFKPIDGLALDVAYPEESGVFPLIVCIHGGGWRLGDKSTWTGEGGKAQIGITTFASRGYVAATINYRLAPAYKLGAMLEDVRAAVDFLISRPEYKADPKRIVFAGDSAGGHLALMAGITLKRAGYGVVGVVNMFGLTDCTDISAVVDNGHLSFVVADMAGSADPKSALAVAASPARILDSDSPPVLTLHGTDDAVIPYPQAVVLQRALKAVGVKNELVPMRRQGHGWGDLKAVKFSTQKVFAFLRKVFKE